MSTRLRVWTPSRKSLQRRPSWTIHTILPTESNLITSNTFRTITHAIFSKYQIQQQQTAWSNIPICFNAIYSSFMIIFIAYNCTICQLFICTHTYYKLPFATPLNTPPKKIITWAQSPSIDTIYNLIAIKSSNNRKIPHSLLLWSAKKVVPLHRNCEDRLHSLEIKPALFTRLHHLCAANAKGESLTQHLSNLIK